MIDENKYEGPPIKVTFFEGYIDLSVEENRRAILEKVSLDTEMNPEKVHNKVNDGTDDVI